MSKRYLTRLAAAGIGCLLLAGCGVQSSIPSLTSEPAPQSSAPSLTGEITPNNASGKEPDAAFAQAQSGFTLKLLQETAAACAGKNILISPYSVMQALAMTANGAAGDTRSQMEQTLGGIPAEQLNQYLLTQRREMPDSENARFRTANSVWLRDDKDRLQFKPDFLQTLRDYYGADAFARAFDESARQEINQWCSGQTDGMIPEMLSEPISPDAVMYLINAVCFDAKWAKLYEREPVNVRFTSCTGEEQQSKMMFSEEGQYLSDERAEGFIKPYRDGYVFAALLPEQGLSAEDYLASLTVDRLHEILTGAEPCTVNAGLPQFSYDFDIEYSGILSDMGMPLAFAGDADFTEMAETASGVLYIGQVLHKTHIDVDTEGTKAAAVTAVEMRDNCDAEQEAPKQVTLDRPFVYFIADAETMTPVFAGVLNEIPQ